MGVAVMINVLGLKTVLIAFFHVKAIRCEPRKRLLLIDEGPVQADHKMNPEVLNKHDCSNHQFEAAPEAINQRALFSNLAFKLTRTMHLRQEAQNH